MAKDTEHRDKVFNALFNTDDGKFVLKELADKTINKQSLSSDFALLAAKAAEDDLYRWILERVKRGGVTK